MAEFDARKHALSTAPQGGTTRFDNGLSIIDMTLAVDYQNRLDYCIDKNDMDMWRDSMRKLPLIGCFLQRFEGLTHAEGASTGFMVASGGVLYEGYGHGGPGDYVGDGQTEAYMKI